MQTHHDSSAKLSSSHFLQEGACLVCGATVPALTAVSDPGEQLHALGWHSWLSHTANTPRRHFSLLRLCPECVADSMFVATRILESHGPDQMEEGIKSMELELG